MTIATPQALPKEISFEDYLQMPEMMQRHEIIDGELIMSPAPSDDHQIDLADLYDKVKGHVRQHRLGFALFAPLDVIIRKQPRLTTRQPDLAFFSAERVGGFDRDLFVAARKRGLAPDLAVEVLSPDESRRRLGRKLADYEEIGVREVWLVSREAQTVELLTPGERGFERAALYGSGDTLVSNVVPGFTLPLDSLFNPED